MQSQKKRRETGTEAKSEKIIVENFPEWMEDINL